MEAQIFHAFVMFREEHGGFESPKSRTQKSFQKML
jgi:hypothetical protein